MPDLVDRLFAHNVAQITNSNHPSTKLLLRPPTSSLRANRRARPLPSTSPALKSRRNRKEEHLSNTLRESTPLG